MKVEETGRIKKWVSYAGMRNQKRESNNYIPRIVVGNGGRKGKGKGIWENGKKGKKEEYRDQSRVQKIKIVKVSLESIKRG